MKYVGMQTQIWRNNRNTVILLCMYPIIILAMVWVFVFVLDYFSVFCALSPEGIINLKPSVVMVKDVCLESSRSYGTHWQIVWHYFLLALPATIVIVATWFTFAYCCNVSLIRHVTHAKPLERKENLRVYNIVENLCIAGGIEMPQINIVEDPGLNAFASGIDIKSFTITLTTGIIEKLDDDELKAVVGHELTHIKNRDTRLMVVGIVFVGLISLCQTIFIQLLKGFVKMGSGSRRRSKKNGGGIFVVLIFFALVGVVITSIAYFFSFINRLAISRKREYVADAGAAELCGDPLPLASALRKISETPGLVSVQRNDVAQLYIIHPDEEEDNGVIKTLTKKIDSIFWTHPDTPERIQILEQF